MTNNTKQSDLHDFFSFAQDPSRTLHSLVTNYVAYHGGLNWGQQNLVCDNIKKALGPDGTALTRSDILEPNGRFTPGFLDQFAPEFTGAYYDRGSSHTICTEILPESKNQWQWGAFSGSMKMRLRLPRRPAFKLYETQAPDLFISPYAYQLFDAQAGIYIPQATSRVLPRSIEQYETISEPDAVVIIQDQYDGGNFSHFLLDWVPRIIYFANVYPELATRCKFLMGGARGMFQNQALQRLSRKFSIPPENFIYPVHRHILKLTSKTYYFSDQIENIMHPLHIGHPDTVEHVRALINQPRYGAFLPEKFYVSRRDALLRSVVNEKELSSALKKLGYFDIALSDFSIDEQIALFQNAQSIVAPHGMGLAHLIFARPGTQILELFNPKIGSDAYAIISRAIGLNYNFMLGEDVEDGKVNFSIDVEKMLAVLSKF